MQEFSVPAVAPLVPGAALPDLVRANAERAPDAAGFAKPDDRTWVNVTNAQFQAEVELLARGFIAQGIGVGDRVAIMARTRYEWTLCDFALWTIAAVPVPIYDSSSADQVQWILEDSAAVACIVESPRHRKVVDTVAPSLPALRHIWVITDGELDTVAATGDGVDPSELESRRAALTGDSVATIIYTSGTTGRPKGCELTHSNFLSSVDNISIYLSDVVGVPGASTLLFLPLAHVFARLIEVLCVRANVRLAHTPTITDLTGKFQSFQPTFILAVPRVFEKVFNGARQRAEADGKAAIFDRAVEVAIRYSEAIDKRGPSPMLRAQHALFDKLVYAKLRKAMGGNVKWAVSGGAPLGPRLGHFFRGMGVTILEGYGLTETTAPTSVNAPTAIRIGTVGRPIAGASICIDDDGEVLVRGPHVFSGYRKDELATAAVLDRETGWFRTGDLGELDDGFLRITGRKKDIIVTAGGKNVAPAPLEDMLRAHPLISQVTVVGDNRSYIAALITLDEEGLAHWFKVHNRPVVEVAQLVDDPEIRSELQDAVTAANKTVSVAEAIKRFAILPIDFTEENGYLTPSLKVKRNLVTSDFTASIDSLYV